MARHFRLISTVMLVLSLLAFFGLMFLLAFFNAPQTDDYNIMKDVRTFGFLGYDKFIYQHWGGRFVSIFLGKIQAYNDGLLTNYWIHTVYLLVANAASCIYLFNTINIKVVRFTEKRLVIWLTSFVYLALQISSLPEISTAYYWFSSAVSYQPAIILIQVELALLVRYLNRASGNTHALRVGKNDYSSSLLSAGIILLIVLINFTNEVSVLINGVILIIAGLLLNGRSRFLVSASVVYIASAYIMINAPGNKLRAENIPSPGVMHAAAYAIGRSLFACWIALKNPLVIIGIITAFIAGQRRVAISEMQEKLRRFPTSPIFVCAIPVVILFVILFPVMYVSNGSFPDRANNEIVQLLIIILLSLALFLGSRHPPGSQQAVLFPFTNYKYLAGPIFAIAVTCNNNFGVLATSALSAPVYSEIMNERINTVKKAAAAKQDLVSLRSYVPLADSIIGYRYATASTTLRSVLRQPPQALYTPIEEAEFHALNKLVDFYGVPSAVIVP